MKGYHLQLANLTDEQIENILKILPPRTQSSRVFKYLAKNTRVKTGQLCAKTSTVNLSHCSQVELNPRIRKFGLVVACERPEVPYKNKFGQVTGEHMWALYQLEDDWVKIYPN